MYQVMMKVMKTGGLPSPDEEKVPLQGGLLGLGSDFCNIVSHCTLNPFFSTENNRAAEHFGRSEKAILVLQSGLCCILVFAVISLVVK